MTDHPDSLVSYKIDFGPPPELVVEFARKYCHEDDDETVMKISELREMIFERGDFCPSRTDDKFLLKFLRARNFSLEASYKLLESYHKFKDDNPELYDIRPTNLHWIGEEDVIQVLPYKDQNHRRIIILKIGNWNVNERAVTELFQAALLTAECGSLEETSQVMGAIIMFDLNGLSLQHARMMSPSLAYKIIEIIAFVPPMKTHTLHVVNESWVFNTIYNFFKPFLVGRMKERIYFHGSDMESLHQHIPPKYLPERYGGSRKDYVYSGWIYENKRSWNVIKELLSCGYKCEPEDLDQIEITDEIQQELEKYNIKVPVTQSKKL